MSIESTVNQINELECVIEANSADVVNSIATATDAGETTKVRLSVIEESLFYAEHMEFYASKLIVLLERLRNLLVEVDG